jgi:hypothetical protein
VWPILRCVLVASVCVLLAGGCAGGGRGSLPAGVVFITERWPHEGGFDIGPVREYVDGRLRTIRKGKLIVARDSARNSLLYDWEGRTVQRIGGRKWQFSPCRDPNGARIVALSPDGKRGVCIGTYSDTGLVLFNVDKPDTTAHVIFRDVTDSPHPVAWIDETHIAVMELRRGRCPYYDRYGYFPTNLAIINTRGHLIRRGPCMAGIMTGPHGLIYIQYFSDDPLVAFFDAFFERSQGSEYFSKDYGGSWQRGTPAFQDANGVIYYWPDYAHDGTLVDESGRAVATSTYDADWSRR